MASRAFSKILILVILIILAGGGIFAWQYFVKSDLRVFGEKFVQALRDQDIKTLEELVHPDVKEYYSLNNPGKIKEEIDSLLNLSQDFSDNPEFFKVQIADVTQTYLEEGYYDVEQQILRADEIVYFPVAPQKFLNVTLSSSYYGGSIFITLPIAQLNDEWFWILPEAKTDWKIYRNQKYGFEIDYPYNSTNIKHGIDSFGAFLPLEPGTRLSEKVFTINVREEEYDQPIEYYCTQGIPHTSIVTFNDIDFCKSEAPEEVEGDSVVRRFTYHTIYNKRWITLSLRLSSCAPRSPGDACSVLAEFNESKEKEIFNQMLSTFKFIEPEEITKDETADWKTYRNKEHGFEMKYPEDFLPTQPLQPKIKVIQCDYANLVNNCPTERTTINSMSFCLQKTSEGAAGTTYVTYNYTTVRDRECFVVSFTVPYPNCSNYLPIESQEIQEAYDKCRLNNEVNKPETINKIISTFRFSE